MTIDLRILPMDAISYSLFCLFDHFAIFWLIHIEFKQMDLNICWLEFI